MAGCTIQTNEKTCGVCMQQKSRENHITASIALYAMSRPLPPEKLYLLQLLKKETPHGPGTELKKLISWFYSPDNKDKCECLSRIEKMNKWGPDKCEARMDTIVRWLQHSAAVHGVPFVPSAVRLLVRRAISNARKQEKK
jgi:hypothetical protein